MRKRNLIIPLTIIIVIAVVVLGGVGVVGALNGWFGGGGSIPEDTMTRGLVGYWGFDEGSGTTAYDASSYANNGTFGTYMATGTPWTTGKVGGALSFDGVDDYVSFSNSMQTQGTVEGWFYWQRQASSGTYQTIFSNFLYQHYANDFLYLEGGAMLFSVIPTLNAWNHILITWTNSSDSATAYLYLNGIQAARAQVASYGLQGLGGLARHSGGGQFLKAKIDEVRIYNRVLSAEEIRYHYNRGGPVAQWSFDEGSGSVAYDATESNNDGTLKGEMATSTTFGWTTGKYGGALSFDGADDYIDAGSAGSSVRTISFWIKRGDTSNKDVIDLGTPEIKISSNTITSAGLTSPTYYVDGIKGNTTVNANEWHHITITDTANISASNVDIGKATTASNYFLGLIDDVRIYNYARTPDEIRLDYNGGYTAHFGPKTDCNSDPGSCMTNGLVGYWSMEEGSGSLTYDASNYGNNGTLTSGPQWTKGKVGSALSFDGSDDYVDAGNGTSLAFPAEYTLEAWVKVNSFTANERIMSKHGNYVLRTSTDRKLYLYIGDAAKTSWAYYGATSVLTLPSTPTWTHIAVKVKVNEAVKFYINGVEDVTATTPTDIWTGTESFNIGNGAWDTYFNGLLDEVRIYNRALSAEEIRYHYNRGGPVAQWKMDEGSGNTAYDSSGNGNTGTLQNDMATTSWTTGKYGTALSFDGTDDYVKVADSNSLDITTAITMSAWIKSNKIPWALYDEIVEKGDHMYTFSGEYQTDEISARLTINGTQRALTTPSANLQQGIWYHIVTTYDGSTWIIYINGVNVAQTTAYSGAISTSAGALSIGARSDVTQRFNGLIDEVRIYNYARTPEEIRLDYNGGFAAHFGPKTDCNSDPGSCMTNGLVGYWPMEEGSGSLTYDASNYGNNGTLTSGPQWTEGKVGSALSFDGTDDYVSLAETTSLSPTAAFTVEAWAKPNDLVGLNSIFYNRGGSGPYRGWILSFTGNQIWFLIGNGTSGTESAISTSYYTVTTQWQHVVMTWDGATTRFYANGKDIGYTYSMGGSIAYMTGGYGINIGEQFTGWGDRYMNGLIDEVRIYNRALSVEEVRYHYNRGGPIAHWKMDEGEGRTAYDSTENNNDGTLVLAGSATSSAWVQGKYGSALNFDGTDDYLRMGSSLSNFDGVAGTIALWINPDVISNTKYAIMFEQNAPWKYFEVNAGIGIVLYNGSISLNISQTGSTVGWHHVAVIWGDGKAYLYVDGKLETSGSVTYTSLTIDEPVMGSNSGSSNFFDGSIDEVRIYNYARTAEQIRQDYNAGLSAHFK